MVRYRLYTKQAATSQDLASASGSGAKFYDHSFEEFATKNDLPEFDFIAMHGVWSWISDKNRQIIIEFIKKRLKVGGILYIGYNTLPGWNDFMPIRNLMTQYVTEIAQRSDDIQKNIEKSLDYVSALIQINSKFIENDSKVIDKFKKFKTQDKQYLAHEFYNKDWHPMYFTTVSKLLQESKLEFGCSANYLDHIDAINLTAEQQQYLYQIKNINLRESIRDYFTNQKFRRDYWIKGSRKISLLEQENELRKQRFILTIYRPVVSLKINGLLGEATLTDEVNIPLLDLMSDYKPRSIGEI